MAQRYFVEWMAKVNLAKDAGGDSRQAWRIVISETRAARMENVLAKEWVDFEVISPDVSNVDERCFLGFDKCVVEIIEKLQDQCRLRR
ncbi:hypothetical protein ABIA71_003756 [Stenotrophomonas sp. 2619]|uniref:hypothetical protein n=1 Tax=Stenotrophomonas sp. 2619 TaxID=3156316 RepID=UPI00339B6D46